MCKIKWIKLDIGMADDEKIKIIDSMPERDTIHYIWIRLLIQAGKTNAAGSIFLNENIPYTKEMLSIIFNRPIELIEFSLKILTDLKMIDIDENSFINILNWEKHQNIEGMERVREQTRKRVEKHRLNKKVNKSEHYEENYEESDDYNNIIKCDLENNCVKNSNVTVTEQNEKENKKKIENKNKTDSKFQPESQCEDKMDIHDSFISKSNNQKEIVDELDVIEYIKKLPKKIKGSNITSIKSAVSIYGGKNVKLAIDKALEVNKPRMNYINGILKNWEIEGFPKDYKNASQTNIRYQSKNNKILNFNNFESRSYDYDALEKQLLGW